MLPLFLRRLFRRLRTLRRPGRAISYFKRWCAASDHLHAYTEAAARRGGRSEEEMLRQARRFNRNADRLLRLSRGDSPWRDDPPRRSIVPRRP